MDNIKEIIQTLSADDVKEFRVFCNRQKRLKERKDLRLFEILSQDQDYKPNQIIDMLYDKPNKNAYHSVRKRLLRNLADFIMVKRMDNDNSSASNIMGLMSLVRYLFEHKSNRLAWNFLKKAEELAINNEQFDLLNGIFNIMIEHNNPKFGRDLKDLIHRKTENKKRVDEDERALIAHALISKKLYEHKVEGTKADFNRLVRKVLKDYKLSEAVLERPKLLYNMLSIVRSGALATKDYSTFEPYIIEHYHAVKDKNGFSPSTHIYKLHILYMLAHVLYRNRKFEETITYLQELRENLGEKNTYFFQQFYPKYLLLLAAVHNFRGNLEMAIEILQSALNDDQIKMGTKDNHNLILNLAVYHFNAEDFPKAIKTIISFPKTDKWIETRIGKEWLMRKNLIELIIQFELGNLDIAKSRVKNLEHHFSDLLEQKPYRRVKTYLEIILEFIKNPEWVKTISFARKAKPLVERNPRESEDTQAMAFYCWLKSKMEGRAYYDVLLETINDSY